MVGVGWLLEHFTAPGIWLRNRDNRENRMRQRRRQRRRRRRTPSPSIRPFRRDCGGADGADGADLPTWPWRKPFVRSGTTTSERICEEKNRTISQRFQFCSDKMRFFF